MVTCETCRWWDKSEPHHTFASCRRWPPRASLGVTVQERGYGGKPDVSIYTRPEAEWPNTAHNDWCGEHQPKDTPYDR